MKCLQDAALQCVRAGFHHLGEHSRAQKVGRTLEVDDPEVGGAAGDMPGLFNGVDQHLLKGANERAVPLPLPVLLGVVEYLEPATLFLGRDIVCPPYGSCARPR
jgi:hypothetical protein